MARHIFVGYVRSNTKLGACSKVTKPRISQTGQHVDGELSNIDSAK